MGEILSALADLIGSLAGADRPRPAVVIGAFLAALIVIALLAAWVLS
jgi:hypothetical protein